MVLVAAASDHRHRRAGKSTRPDTTPVAPSPSKVATGKESAGSGLLGFSFSWGAHRRLRCSKDGAPAYASSSPSSLQNQHTPSPDKEDNPKSLTQGDGAGTGSSSRPLRYAASSRPDGAGHQAALQSPKTPAPPRKRGFAVALSKEEIARDFAAIRRCATRPLSATRRSSNSKKRPRPVQNAIDMVCPGLILLDVDLDNYKIEERGLKR